MKVYWSRNKADGYSRMTRDAEQLPIDCTSSLFRSDLDSPMDALTLFGSTAVTAMLICYALEDRSRTFILAFAASCVFGSVYGFLQGAWPFGVLEAIWSLVAVRRWLRRRAAPV